MKGEIFHSVKGKILNEKSSDIENILDKIKGGVGEKVLLAGDIGKLGKELRLNGMNVTIMENTNYEDVCYSLVHNENCNFVKGTLEYIPFENNYFDKVIVLEQFNCTGNYKKASSEISRVLKENGELILEDFNLNKIKSKVKYIKRKVCGLCGNDFYPQDISRIFANLRFDGFVHENRNHTFLYIAKKRA